MNIDDDTLNEINKQYEHIDHLRVVSYLKMLKVEVHQHAVDEVIKLLDQP